MSKILFSEEMRYGYRYVRAVIQYDEKRDPYFYITSALLEIETGRAKISPPQILDFGCVRFNVRGYDELRDAYLAFLDMPLWYRVLKHDVIRYPIWRLTVLARSAWRTIVEIKDDFK